MHNRNDDIATQKDEWVTPDALYNKLDAEFQFNLDAACTTANQKGFHGFGLDASQEHPEGAWIHEHKDALTSDWNIWFSQENGGRVNQTKVFLNPPYSNGMLEKFMKKAYFESLKGTIVVCLVPFSGAGWFKRWCMKAYEIRIVGRVRFVGYLKDGTEVQNTPTFDSCVVILDVEMKKHMNEKHGVKNFPLLTVFT